MAKKTRLSLDGYYGRRAGSFANKRPHGHPVGKITRMSMDGYMTRRTGSFAGKGGGVTPTTIKKDFIGPGRHHAVGHASGTFIGNHP